MTHGPQLRNSESAAEHYFIVASTVPEEFSNFLQLASVGHKEIEGCYKGEIERAWVINNRDHDYIRDNVPTWCDQESVLHLGAIKLVDGVEVRSATLKFTGQINGNEWQPIVIRDRPQDLGYLWPVDEATARSHDAWSRDGDQYYVCGFNKPQLVINLWDTIATAMTPYAKLEAIHCAIQEAMAGNLDELDRALELVEILREEEIEKEEEALWQSRSSALTQKLKTHRV
jgi:hypothetical protein